MPMIRSFKSTQRGVTLFLALIVLVAMMLSGIALFRSVDSGIFVAGNIAMQKSATRQGDQGTETALAWLIANAASGLLHNSSVPHGYVANGLNDMPIGIDTWAQWWDVYTIARPPVSLPADANTGNTVSYLIQRLCIQDGAPYQGATTCAGPPLTSTEGSSNSSSSIALERPTAVYYRITSRIVGPRNTVSFIQSVVSL